MDNERTLEFITDNGYAFAENAPRSFTATDENIECEEDPIGTTLVVRFETSDGGSIEGTPYQFYAPQASQVAQAPYAEGEIGAGNQIVLDEIIAGTYRLVTAPEGYEPIDVTFAVIADETSEVQIIAVAALQPVETPTPEPTIEPTAEPTIEPTVIVTPDASPSVSPEPTEVATETTADVTGLPSTGSGSSGGFGILALAGLLAAMVLGIISKRRVKN